MTTYPYDMPLVNPGGETGSMTGWTMISGSNGSNQASGSDVPSHSGTRYFVGSATVANAQWGQMLDLPSDTYSDADAELLRIVASVWMQGYSADTDNGTLKVECFASDGTTLLATNSSGPHDPTAWEQKSAVVNVPANTRKVRISVVSVRNTGTQNSIYYDDFSLSLQQRPVVPAGSHRFWRLKFDSNGNAVRGCCVASEIEFREAVRGADVTGTGSAFASSVTGAGFEANKAFDNNNSTMWHDNCSNPAAAWVAYDFGDGNEKNIVEVMFRARDGSYGDDDSIMTGGVERSDDGVTWTRDWTIAPQTRFFADNEIRYFAKPPNPALADVGGHRYWRVRLTTAGNPGNSFEGLGAVQFWRQGAWVSYFGRGFDPGNLQAGNPVRAWYADGPTGVQWNGADTNQWLAYDFGTGQAVLPDELRVRPNSDDPARTWLQFAIDYSDDGSAWTEAAIVAPPVLPWVAATEQTMTFGSTPPVTTRRRGFMAVTG